MHVAISENGNVTIVAPNESIAIIPSQLAVDVLFSLLERNIHVAINRLKLPCERTRLAIRTVA